MPSVDGQAETAAHAALAHALLRGQQGLAQGIDTFTGHTGQRKLPRTGIWARRQKFADLCLHFGQAGRISGLSPADLDSVREKVSAGCQVLGLRYTKDVAVGTRFDTLREEFGDNFIAVEFPGAKHATLTLHRQQEGVDRVLAFFDEKLR